MQESKLHVIRETCCNVQSIKRRETMRLSECWLNGVFLAIVHLSLSFTMLLTVVFVVGKMTVPGFFMLIASLQKGGKGKLEVQWVFTPYCPCYSGVFCRMCQVNGSGCASYSCGGWWLTCVWCFFSAVNPKENLKAQCDLYW